MDPDTQFGLTLVFSLLGGMLYIVGIMWVCAYTSEFKSLRKKYQENDKALGREALWVWVAQPTIIFLACLLWPLTFVVIVVQKYLLTAGYTCCGINLAKKTRAATGVNDLEAGRNGVISAPPPAHPDIRLTPVAKGGQSTMPPPSYRA
ncbi:hypothetical protein QBC39DRAFT_374435 [Podospora conica]|nr:hypothetical protein QBC39DRAFT_374435 [Schizothecium conicum]